MTMRAEEVVQVGSAALREYRVLGYDDLAALVVSDTVRTRWLSGESGVEYQVEVLIQWDDAPGGAIRVSAFVDDGRLRSTIRPSLGDEFIVAPDGSFLGE